MKKLFRNVLMLSAMAGTVLFTACDGEGDEVLLDPPSVTVTTDPADAEVEVGEPISFTANVIAPAGFNTIRIVSIESPEAVVTLDNYQSEYTRNDLGLDAGVTDATVPFEPFSIPAAGVFTVELLAVDDENQSTTFTFDIVVTEAGIEFYEQVLFGGQGNNEEGFYNALDNERYTYAQARDASGVSSSPVDFAYYWGETNQNTIASIDDDGLDAVYSSVNLPIEGIFGTRNSTRFHVTGVSPAEFLAIENNSELVAVADSELNVNSSATDLQVGSVVAFELDAARGGYVGLIHVTEINDTNGNGTITIEVKVQSVTE